MLLTYRFSYPRYFWSLMHVNFSPGVYEKLVKEYDDYILNVKDTIVFALIGQAKTMLGWDPDIPVGWVRHV